VAFSARVHTSRVDPELQADCRTELEVRFLARLESGPAGIGEVWLWPGFPLIATWCVWEESSPVLRTLRADFDGSQVRCGNDPNHNMDEPLDPSDPDHLEGPAGESPEAAADTAGHWFRAQLDRPIDRHEWHDGRYVRWVLADTGVALCSQVAGGIGWQPGGAWDATQPAPAELPDRVVTVWPRAT
jgi:hypothetical protein